ncbi:MAG: LysM peptidoglycan-binding domain-containing protein [Chloroflexota bacterium]
MRNRTLTMNRVPSESVSGPPLSAISLQVLLILVASLLWFFSLGSVDFSQMNDLGLISVMPPAIFAAIVLLTISFCLTLRSADRMEPVLIVQVVVLIVMLYGITVFVEEEPRFGVTWLHAGFTEHIMRTGTVAPNLEARFNWPGFFVLNAALTQLAGLESPLAFASWSAVVLNFLYLAPLYVMFRAATSDKRLIWLAIWFFFVTNWVGQDYFAPQALSYFQSLVILSIVLYWFNTPYNQTNLPSALHSWGPTRGLVARFQGLLDRETVSPAPSTPFQRIGLVIVLFMTFAAIVPSHQLTPQYEIIAMMALVVLSRCSMRSLPILMAGMVAGWLSFMTLDYLVGHFDVVTGGVGQVGQTVSANVTDRLAGSPEHIFVIQMRLVMTLAIWGLAFLGGLSRLRTGQWDITYAVLALVPFSVLLLQSYGGEAILRIYFFALPFMSFFAAALFFTTPQKGVSWRTTTIIGVVSLLLLTGFHLSRYGNERMDYKTTAEVAGAQYIYDNGPTGAQIVVSMQGSAWRYQDYEQYRYRSIRDAFLAGDNEFIIELMGNPRVTESYLLLTRSQQAYAELFLGLPVGTWDAQVEELKETGEFTTVFSNADAEVLVLTNPPERTANQPDEGAGQVPDDGDEPTGTDEPVATEQPTSAPTSQPSPTATSEPAPTATSTPAADEEDSTVPPEPETTPEPTAVPPTPEPEDTTETPNLPEGVEIIDHIIQPGDILVQLAQQYETTVVDIIALNRGIEPVNLAVGDVIRIPVSSATQPEFQLGYFTHVVQRGEILYLIAERYDVSIEDIVALNPNINPESLVVGEVLRIPGEPPPARR